MMKMLLYRLVTLFLLLIMSACGDDGNFTSQSETNTSVTLTADKTQVVADGTDGVTLTATVTDATGSPLAHQVVSFAVPQPFLNLPIVRHTDENGRLVLFLRTSPFRQQGIPATITQADITATSLGITSTPVTVTINPKPVPAAASVTLVTDKIQATADGRDTITFTATVKDETGAPISGQVISFQVPPGPNPFATPRQTDGNGRAEFRLTMSPSVPGPDKVLDVTATSGSVTSNVVTVTFSNPPQVAPALVTITSDKSTLIADGNDRVVFTISATDSNGEPLAGQLFVLNVPSGPFTWRTQVATNTAGHASASLACITGMFGRSCPATVSITATINGTTSNPIDIAVSPP